jgi:hypothetical protein
MKKQPKSLTSLVLSTVAGISVSLLLPQPSWAQTTNVNPLEDLNSEQSSDPFSRTNEDNSFGIFDLIHRANLGSGRSIDDYTSEQDQSLNTAAAEFRKKQQERLRVQQQATPTNPVTTPQVAN